MGQGQDDPSAAAAERERILEILRVKRDMILVAVADGHKHGQGEWALRVQAYFIEELIQELSELR